MRLAFILPVLFAFYLAVNAAWSVYCTIAPAFQAINTAMTQATQRAGESASGKPTNQR